MSRDFASPPSWPLHLALNSGLAALTGAGAALFVLHRQAARRLRGLSRHERNIGSFPSEAGDGEEETEPLGSEIREWLQSHGLLRYDKAFCFHGYCTLELLRDLTDLEVDELIHTIKPRAGHAATLRRALRRLKVSVPCPEEEMLQTAPQLIRPAADAGEVEEQEVVLQEPASRLSKSKKQNRNGCEPGPEHQGCPSGSSNSSSSGSGSGRANAPLSIGMPAVLSGLAKRPELNGCTGTLTAFDEASGRWMFTLDGGKGVIRARPENVKALLSCQAGHGEKTNQADTDAELPEEFRCCITRELMEQPVFTSDGHTYERAAITRWLEEHGTSPKTGQQLPDRVLRPNHAVRAQILAWREQHGLPPLPQWEPEPQETVQEREPNPQQMQLPHGMPARTVTVQTPAGSVVLPLTFFQGQQTMEANIPHMLRTNEALRDDVLSVLREQAATSQLGDDESNVLQEPDVEDLAGQVVQNPHLMEIVMQHLHSNPEAQHSVGQVGGTMVVGSAGVFAGGPAGPAGPPESPIFRAAREGECGVVEQFLGPRSGARLQQEVSASGESLLHVASWWGHSRLVAMLLAREHAVHVSSRNRSTPLHYAAFRGHLDVVRMLLDAQADTQRRMAGGDTALHQAAWQDHVPVLQLLLDRGAALYAMKDDGDSALALGASRGHASVCRELLGRMAADARPEGLGLHNKRGHTPLHAAATGGSGEVVKLLVEATAPVDARTDTEETPLHRAVQVGATESVRILLESGAEVDTLRLEDDHTPLMVAVLEGRTGLVKVLLDHMASVMRARRDGLTPLHLAAIREASTPRRTNEDSLISVLVQARAEVDSRTRARMTPLHLLLSQLPQAPHRSSALRVLLDQRADIEAALRDGERPLHLTVRSNQRVEAALLLEQRCDVNAARDDGCAALHIATQHGISACVELLTRARADLSHQNADGQTPADIARRCGLTQIERMLERSGQG